MSEPRPSGGLRTGWRDRPIASAGLGTGGIAMPHELAPIHGLPVVSQEPYLTRRELASLMGVSLSTVDSLRKEGMPHTTWGRRTVRFRASTALAWANAREPKRRGNAA